MVHFMSNGQCRRASTRRVEQEWKEENFHTINERKKFFDPQRPNAERDAYMKCNLLPIALSPLICFSCSQLYMCSRRCCFLFDFAQAKAPPRLIPFCFPCIAMITKLTVAISRLRYSSLFFFACDLYHGDGMQRFVLARRAST